MILLSLKEFFLSLVDALSSCQDRMNEFSNRHTLLFHLPVSAASNLCPLQFAKEAFPAPWSDCPAPAFAMALCLFRQKGTSLLRTQDFWPCSCMTFPTPCPSPGICPTLPCGNSPHPDFPSSIAAEASLNITLLALPTRVRA